MWQRDWADKPPNLEVSAPISACSGVDIGEIDAVYALYWCEHCIECAIPQCYSLCPLYVRRRDGKCARFRYGIFPHPGFRGLSNSGADVEFRRWGKLESWLRYGPTRPATLRRLELFDKHVLRVVNFLATLAQPLDPKRKINGGYAFFRDKFLQAVTRRRGKASFEFDVFMVEVWNPSDQPLCLIIEAHQEVLKYRTSLKLASGPNFYQIPFRSMNLDLGDTSGRILVYPDNDCQARLIFTWLDFVKFRQKPVEISHNKRLSKVKCVVWDLDNTLWKGILIEDGPECVSLDPAAKHLVQLLDERGVIQSVASKNDYALAWPLLEKFGLSEYFLYPAIHWGPKSGSMRKIAEELNIGIDALALIDDSPFERAEVARQVPGIRVYDANEMETLLSRPEFDLPVTEEARRRRAMYLAEAKRRLIAESYVGNYEEFLMTCQMEALVFTPAEPGDIERCLELLQRSNQLNLTTYRYQRDEFARLLEDRGTLSVATKCKDRFGEYGIVGFASIDFHESVPVLKDFVLSCRVAQKKVENALFKWVIGRLAAAGYGRLTAWFVDTDRNGVLLRVLEEVGFREISRSQGRRLFELSIPSSPPSAEIVLIRERGIRDIGPSSGRPEAPHF